MHCIIKYDFIALDLSFKKKKVGSSRQNAGRNVKVHSTNYLKDHYFIFLYAKVIIISEIYVRISKYFSFISLIRCRMSSTMVPSDCSTMRSLP